MVKIFLAALLTVSSHSTASCPFDGHMASASGKMRIRTSGIECEYKHVEFKYYQSMLVDEHHNFWQVCQ